MSHRFLTKTLPPLLGLGVILVLIVGLWPFPRILVTQNTAPTLRLNGLDGKAYSLEDWRGQVLLVNFWASWCAPCQAEIPVLVRWQDQYGTHGLQVIGVGIDNIRRLNNVRRSLGINYPVLVAAPEQSEDLLPQWGDTERIVPYTVVVDRNGHIVHRQLGELEMETFNAVVLPLL